MPKKTPKQPQQIQRWDRQPNESEPAWQAFHTYRDLDASRRSHKAVSQKLSKSESLMKRWSARWDWVERVEAYEAFLDRQWVDSAARQRRKAAERHVSAGLLFQRKAVEAAGALSASKLSPRELATFMALGVKIERDAIEETKKIHFASAAGEAMHDPLESLSPEERILKLREMRSKIDLLLEDIDGDFAEDDDDSDYDDDELEPEEVEVSENTG